MVKSQKSSATSGTRKKNARKAAQAAQGSSSAAPPPSPVPKQSKPKDGKNSKLSKREAREQRRKVFIPPVKPSPPVLDPLDTAGLSHLLPPELVIVLRALGKKDTVTRGKAIEELAKWVEEAIKEQATRDCNHTRDEEELGGTAGVVVKMLPVWLHRAPVLFTHPARRLRHLAASLQVSLLRLNPAREALLAWTSEIATQGNLETLLGTWAMLAHDVDRGVAAVGRKAWTDFVSTTPNLDTDIRDVHSTGFQAYNLRSQPKITLIPSLLITLFKFAQSVVLDPQGLHAALNPAPIFLSPVPSSQHSLKRASQDKNLPQGKGIAQGKKGSSTPQPHQKKSERYTQPSSSDSPAVPSSLLDQALGDGVSEENDSDRDGRLRVGALGVIKWILENWPAIDPPPATNIPILTSLLSSPALWSTLHPAVVPSRSNPANQQPCPFCFASFGQGQPQLRQAAWALVGSLVGVFKSNLSEPLNRILCTAILRSAWVETDIGVRGILGGALILFLKDNSQAWSIDMESASRGYNNLVPCVKGSRGDDFDSNSDRDAESEVDSDSEMDDDSVNDTRNTITKPPPDDHLISEAYLEFLQFLELGCSGSPIEGYPLVLVVLANIPESILPTDLPPTSLEGGKECNSQGPFIHPISQLLTSFWAPLDAGLLDRRSAATSWLKALCECLILIVKRGVHTENVPAFANKDARSLLASQFSRLWTELITKRLRVEGIEAAGIIARAAEVFGKIEEGLFDASFDGLCSTIFNSLHTSNGTTDLAPTFFHVFTSTFAPNNHASRRACRTVDIYTQRIIEILETAVNSSDQTPITDAAKESFAAFMKLMDTFGPSLFDDGRISSRIDTIFVAHPVILLQMSTPGVLAYLKHRSRCSDQSQGLTQTQTFWIELLGAISSSSTKLASSLLSPLVDASLPPHLRGTNTTMNDLIGRLASNVIAGSREDEEMVLAKVLSNPGPFVSSECLATIASMLSNSVATFAEARLRFTGASPTKLDEAPVLVEVGHIVRLVKILLESDYEFIGECGAELYTGIFLLGYVIPYQGTTSSDEWVEIAKVLWSRWTSREGERRRQMKDVVGSLVREKLKRVVVDEEAETRPECIIRCITPSLPGIPIDPLVDILPSREEFDAMLESPSLPSSTTSPGLALLDSTFPTSPKTPTSPNTTCRIYARAVSALLTYLATSRTIARSNLWALRHILVLGFYVNECLRAEDAQYGHLMFGLTRDHSEDIVEKMKSLTTYLLSRVEDGVHAEIMNALMNRDGIGSPTGESLASFVVAITRCAKEKDSVRDAAVLGTVLQHLFSDATKDDADLWLTFARRLEKTAPQTTIAILASITTYAPEPLKLDRYRNELAASLIGVRPGAASTIGLTILRLLAATAPSPDSDVIFLPQQRAVNVMKACQAWIASDEDEDGVDEDVESAMTLVFLYLAPILQNVPGLHWGFIWDVIENNLESCSLQESATLTTLGRTLRLVIAIDDLASTNKPLRADWEERRTTTLRLIRDLVAVNSTAMPYCEPRALCWELALSIIQDMPPTMMNEKTLPRMCHLLGNESQEVQRMGYHLLHNAARKRTEHYVIEAGVDTEDAVNPELPPELLVILQQSVGAEEMSNLGEQSIQRNKEVSGYLLAWMITFDLFMDASMKVRSAYFNHMRSLDIISQHFIPNIFDILGLFSGRKQTFKLDVWIVEEFHLDTYEPESSLSLQLLAAHLYHRALLTVPALIRSWTSDCTDKQLLMRVVDYTSSYFSPGIIKAELAQVRQPDASSELSTTENLAVKVSPSSGEVTASYTVDEQALELSIRMPSDWPLHRLEVRDTKMVGVSEDKWRAWILGVQQVVWQQNGRVADGLTLFTKNVALHFSGQVECAICYSIISMMDASLPQKPCKTCKNRFHASCLYKWFKTSHSSSCPLCRSDIL